MYVVRFVYPPVNVTEGPTPAQQIDERLASAYDSRPRNVDYWFCGHRSLKPAAASDDGVHTRLTFAPKAEWPAIFVRNEDSSESLLNFSVDNGDLVVHRVARTFVLRRGRLTACVVNKGFEGSGERLPSGTVSSSVARERKGGRK
jgi:type IV secretion system protein VirB9